MSDSDTGGGIPLLEPEFDGALSNKRKRKHDFTADDESKKNRKKAKRQLKKKQKAKEINDEDLDADIGINHAFERMDHQILADYINQRTRLYGKELSSVELEDKFISAQTIQDTSSWEKVRDLDNLAEFLIAQVGKMKNTPKQPPGAPHTLVITASGIRAADTFRALKTGLPKQKLKNQVVAKLFAKHIKLAEAIETCKKLRMDFGVGTPERISTLLDQNALSTANLQRIVVDVSYIDQKKRGILDMKELHESLLKLLLRKEFEGEADLPRPNFLVFF